VMVGSRQRHRRTKPVKCQACVCMCECMGGVGVDGCMQGM